MSNICFKEVIAAWWFMFLDSSKYIFIYTENTIQYVFVIVTFSDPTLHYAKWRPVLGK